MNVGRATVRAPLGELLDFVGGQRPVHRDRAPRVDQRNDVVEGAEGLEVERETERDDRLLGNVRLDRAVEADPFDRRVDALLRGGGERAAAASIRDRTPPRGRDRRGRRPPARRRKTTSRAAGTALSARSHARAARNARAVAPGSSAAQIARETARRSAPAAASIAAFSTRDASDDEGRLASERKGLAQELEPLALEPLRRRVEDRAEPAVVDGQVRGVLDLGATVRGEPDQRGVGRRSSARRGSRGRTVPGERRRLRTRARRRRGRSR